MNQFRNKILIPIIMLTTLSCAVIGIWHVLSSGMLDEMLYRNSLFSQGGTSYSLVGYHDAPASSAPTLSFHPVAVHPMVSSYPTYSHSASADASYKESSSYSAHGLVLTSGHIVHSYGGAAGAGYSFGGSSASSSPVTTTTAYSVSVPMLAVTRLRSSSSSMLAETSVSAAPGRRKAKPTYSGEDGQTVVDGGETWIYDEEAGDWTNATPEGTTKVEDGKVYQWNGSSWVYVNDQPDPDTPVGAVPWLFFILLAAGYATIIARKRHTVL